MVNLTKHAQKRLQQRGIPVLVLNTLLDYGSCTHDKKGCLKWFFTKRDISKVRTVTSNKTSVFIEKFKGVYLVCDNAGLIITCGHRTSKIRRS